MRLVLKIVEDWSALSYSNHLFDLSILYRWELGQHFSEYAKSDTDSELVKYFFSGRHLGEGLFGPSWTDLRIVSIQYGSPTTETFEGAVRGLASLAGLIERLIFFKQSKRLKDLEIREKELELLRMQAETFKFVNSVFEQYEISADDRSRFLSEYKACLYNFYGLLSRGNLKEVSVTKELDPSGPALLPESDRNLKLFEESAPQIIFPSIVDEDASGSSGASAL